LNPNLDGKQPAAKLWHGQASANDKGEITGIHINYFLNNFGSFLWGIQEELGLSQCL
jgi:hypothetical protein